MSSVPKGGGGQGQGGGEWAIAFFAILQFLGQFLLKLRYFCHFQFVFFSKVCLQRRKLLKKERPDSIFGKLGKPNGPT